MTVTEQQEFKDMNIKTLRDGYTPEYEKKMDIILEAIGEEVARAKGIFESHFNSQHEAYAVALEEFDELWDEIKKNQKDYDLVAQRKEATQTAAMLVR